MENPVKLTVIIPVYNEARTVEKIIKKVVDVKPCDKEIIVVDDCSNDGTGVILNRLKKNFNFILITNSKNLGKGASLIKALEVAKGDIVVPQDADLEVDPSDYPILMEPILNGKADAVFGTRLRHLHRGDYILRTLFINELFVYLTNLLYSSHYTDILTCYKMCKINVLRELSLESCRFDIEPEIACKLAKRKYKIAEVPISYSPRRWKDGKKIKWADSFSIIKAIIKYRFKG